MKTPNKREQRIAKLISLINMSRMLQAEDERRVEVDHVISDLSQQRERDISALMNKHEQQIAELISKHEQAVLELKAGQEMMMRSEVVQRRSDDVDTSSLVDSLSVVATSSTDSVYMKTKPAHWVWDRGGNRTRTRTKTQNKPKKPELFGKLNPNRTKLSYWSNGTEPELYAVRSIHISIMRPHTWLTWCVCQWHCVKLTGSRQPGFDIVCELHHELKTAWLWHCLWTTSSTLRIQTCLSAQLHSAAELFYTNFCYCFCFAIS